MTSLQTRPFPRVFDGGRDRDRTCDPSRVKDGILPRFLRETADSCGARVRNASWPPTQTDIRVLNALCVLKTIIAQAEAGSDLAGRAAIDAANVVDAIGRAALGKGRL